MSLTKRNLWFAGIFLGALIGSSLLVSGTAWAGTVVLRPNGDPAVKNWTPSTGTVNWSIINRSDLATTTWICGAAGNVSDLYDMTTASVGQGATSVTVQVNSSLGRRISGGLADDQAGVDLQISGSLIGPTTYATPSGAAVGVTETCTSALFGTGYSLQGASFAGTWTQAQIDGMRILIARKSVGPNDPIRISQAMATVTYTDPPTLDQSAYRAYQNADSSTPGTPLASTNTVAELPTSSSPFRIRMGLTLSGTAWGANYGANKLQVTAKDGATCALSTGWADVQAGSGAIRWNDNASPVDGVTITSNANDPTTSGTKIYQQYRESNDFTNPNAAPLTNVALWDYSLKASSTTPGVHYCFRAVNSTGSITINYSQYPEIIAVGDLGIEFVDAGGSNVPSPSFSFDNIFTTSSSCQLPTALLGTSSQRMRVTNNLVTNGWSVSMAATSGPTALWVSGLNSYDFNDSGGSPAGCANSDGDGKAGQLTVRPSSGTLAPEAGCATTGISWGSDAGFAQGVTDAITLSTASSASARFCYFDYTSIDLEQRVPPGIVPGTYQLDMTVTVMAS